MTAWETVQFWAKGVRLYIAAGTLIISAQAWWWAHTAFTGDPSLIAARLHEVYGWLALALLAITLGIGPAYKLVPGMGGAKLMRDARRLLGISAAWFASLHAAIAYIVSFQAVNLLEITAPYRQAFLLGGLALLVLLALAITSFNGAMKYLGIWWFRLHRLIYVAVVLAVLHALAIGVHAATIPALAMLIGAALLLFISHVSILWLHGAKPSIWQVATLGGLFVLLIFLSNYGIQQYIDQNSLQGHGHR
jgi:sulfoxide reductase heme-binding subunit YedZ